MKHDSAIYTGSHIYIYTCTGEVKISVDNHLSGLLFGKLDDCRALMVYGIIFAPDQNLGGKCLYMMYQYAIPRFQVKFDFRVSYIGM